MKKTTTSTETRGRPTVFDSEMETKIIDRYLQGDTDDEVAEFIGIHVNTLSNWKKRYKTFLWSTREAKQFADGLMEMSMFKNGLGYNYTEKKITADGREEIYHKHARGDSTIQKYWANNRMKKRWKERVEVTHEAGATLALNLGTGQKKFDV